MNVSMEDRVSVLENRVANVSNLAATTAKGVGKDRSQRQMVVFATGEFKQRLLELLEKWVAGAQAAKASTTPSETTILPFKLQVVQAVVAQLENQGLTGEILSTLKMAPRQAVEACFYKDPPTEADKAWILNVLFSCTSEGLALRSLFNRPEVQLLVAKNKTTGEFPPCGLRAARFMPGPVLRQVLSDVGHSEEQIKGWFKGKGKGAQSSASGKRPADRRGSTLARDDGRTAKR